jgi:hypothetical protein
VGIQDIGEEPMSSFGDRIIRASKLDASLYEEVEKDRGAIRQAVAVVVLASISAGLGGIAKAGLGGLFIGTLTALIGWCVWAYITYIVGTKLLPEPQTKADYGQLLRAIGFASSPGLIRVIGIVPALTKIVFLLTTIWMLVAMVVAVRQALDYQSTLKAVVVCVIGLVVQALFFALLFSIFGAPGRPV